MRRRLGRAAFTAGLCLPCLGAAAAPHPSARLGYVYPADARCPASESLQDAMSASLGYDPFTTREDAPLLSIAIHAEELALVADITLADPTGRILGQQTLRSKTRDCAVLASAVALAGRLTLERNGALLTDANAAAAPSPAQDLSISVAAGAAATQSLPQWVFGFGPLLALGASVSANAGILLGGEIRWRSWSLGLDLRGDFPDAITLPAGAREQTWLFAGGVVPCRRFGALAACGLWFVGREEAQGFGLDGAQTFDSLYSAVGARLQVELWPWKAFGLALSADALFPLARAQTLVSGQPEWTTPPFSVVVWISGQGLVL